MLSINPAGAHTSEQLADVRLYKVSLPPIVDYWRTSLALDRYPRAVDIAGSSARRREDFVRLITWGLASPRTERGLPSSPRNPREPAQNHDVVRPIPMRTSPQIVEAHGGTPELRSL